MTVKEVSRSKIYIDNILYTQDDVIPINERKSRVELESMSYNEIVELSNSIDNKNEELYHSNFAKEDILAIQNVVLPISERKTSFELNEMSYYDVMQLSFLVREKLDNYNNRYPHNLIKEYYKEQYYSRDRRMIDFYEYYTTFNNATHEVNNVDSRIEYCIDILKLMCVRFKEEIKYINYKVFEKGEKLDTEINLTTVNNIFPIDLLISSSEIKSVDFDFSCETFMNESYCYKRDEYKNDGGCGINVKIEGHKKIETLILELLLDFVAGLEVNYIFSEEQKIKIKNMEY